MIFFAVVRVRHRAETGICCLEGLVWSADVTRIKTAETATIDELIGGLEGLSTADHVRLRDYARGRIIIAGRAAEGDWRDLLAEAIDRLLDGRRAWKKTVPLVITIIGIMRSITSNDWIAPFERQGKYVLRDADLPLGSGDEELATETAAGDAPAGEDVLLGREADAAYFAAAAALRQHFAASQRSVDVIDAIAMELTGPEIKDLLTMSQTELETIMRSIRRAARKLFGSFDQIGKDGTGGKSVS